MRLLQLKAENFRLIRTLSLHPHGRLNVIFGANAAGKTSLLEILYVLGRGRSFRGASPQEWEGPDRPGWLVFGRVEHPLSALRQSLGLRFAGEQTEIRVDGRAATSLDLLRTLPVQILEPGMHKMLQEGPVYRRSFLDWGVFHVEPQFLPLWRRYRRALRQRNQLLRAGADDRQIAAWEPELAEAGEQLDAQRCAHLDAIRPAVLAGIEVLIGEGEWHFDLYPGWTRTMALREVLARQRTADRRLGSTQAGPHRAELRIRAGGHRAKNRISRGQQKMLIAALLLAQCTEIGRRTGRHPVLLIDDFTAELAEPYQAALLAAIQAYPGQTFITAFTRSGVLARELDAAVFHVEHGVVTSSAD
ncbi:DNA replication and repair protein RecF [Fontimonas thermophila]|uniref:DNA replication and repair protein RecF n=1 Tax=Fontimonas thermophila TaxID=1076937 RepID=A0A1I2H9B7_9GAMM|nr:DNA replication/repair protein RecF [Fontimonas thermophila]SFF25191.1 DNA replication and repair protein RecF [Fontimonas thermophila]